MHRPTYPARLKFGDAAKRRPTVAFAVLAIVLTSVSIGALLHLRGAASRDRRTQAALSDLGRQTNLLSSLEWQARAASRGERPAIRRRVEELVVSSRRAEETIVDDPDTSPVTIALAGRFQNGVLRELTALDLGQFERVEQIDTQVVDPSFERLQPVLDKALQAEGADVSRSLRLADFGSIAFVVLALFAALGLMAVVSRVRRRSLEVRTVALHEQAHRDALTGLPNRRELLSDLEAALSSDRRSLLALLDLDGFKAYNDSFGHVEGDLLLRRLATKLADAVVPDGRAYRLGGDEFCVLWHGGAENDLARLGVAAAALGDQGEGFVVTAARGAVTLPDEAQTSDEALRVADHRMYAHKRGRSTATKEQIRNVALSAMAEQAGDEDSDVADVARMATSVGKRLGIQGEGLRDLAYAAELHDVGKIAIPDTILHKVGPLDDDEMEFMRRHTIIGEAILGAAPAFFTVAKYVRSSHERFDGSGYPDGLSGSDIPLASRVVFVCDAFSAMTGQRCYRPRMTTAQARDELRRCAGSQFDPEAVQAFCDVLDSPPAVPAPVGALALR